MKQLKKIERHHLVFGLCFSICMAIFLWRCTLSINYYDEPYGIAAIWRFFKGGAILAEDWHPSQQLTSWILYPLYWFWYTILGGNDGIMLGFRISYVVFQGIITVYCYYRLRKYKYFAAASVLLFMFSTHNNMTTLNYNTVGIGCMMVLLTTLFTEEAFHRRTLILCGILTAVIVLAQPYSILIFILWGMAVSTAWLFGRKKEIPRLLKVRTFFYVSVGAVMVLAAFLMIVFSRADLQEILTGIYYNLNDPEHQMDLSYKVSKYFERFYRYYKFQILTIFASAIAGCVKKDKISGILKIECLILSTVAFIYALVYHGWISDYVPIDFISVPMAFYGISIFMISSKKNWKLFLGWIIPALLYTFCVQLATDTGILAVSAATIIASAGGALLVADGLLREKEFLSKEVFMIFTVLLISLNILQAGLFLYQRVFYTWWSAPIQECTEVVEKGPAKGIRTSREDLEWYENALAEIDSLELTEEDNLLILEHASWLYLYADIPVATYSFWSVGQENFLDEYYELYPEKQPTVVYTSDIEDAENKSYIQKFLGSGYKLTEYESGNISLRK